MSASVYKQCTLCPRECKADRTRSVGFCGMGDIIIAAKAMVHTSEEPCISGDRGSGAVFFSGCVLRCEFCQNSAISHDRFGIPVNEERLSEIYLDLQKRGVHNINLVSGTHFYPSILRSLELIHERLTIPVIWNTGGYEKEEAVGWIAEYCSVFLQDIKYYSDEAAFKYSHCKDYYVQAMKATHRMLNMTGDTILEDGLIKRGVIIRHLVLPGNRNDSIALLQQIKASFGTEGFLLSLMSQYTPPKTVSEYKELNRRITDFEYKSVCDAALDMGFKGYFQSRESATSVYTPKFDLSGL